MPTSTNPYIAPEEIEIGRVLCRIPDWTSDVCSSDLAFQISKPFLIEARIRSERIGPRSKCRPVRTPTSRQRKSRSEEYCAEYLTGLQTCALPIWLFRFQNPF